jgi:hypothetical protein
VALHKQQQQQQQQQLRPSVRLFFAQCCFVVEHKNKPIKPLVSYV